MPGQPPKYRLFLSDEKGNMPTDDSGFWVELAALWPTRQPDKHGNEKYSGKTGNGDQYVLMVQNAPKQRRDDAPPPSDGDVPF